ncbi:uncharacterized protein LOC124795065 isoform X3 [Schistocerca piceifrons]|uniref:uncharacterized protein LOC124795065 isoform X3 n=1 Tax=Schistocerca piceifrons TaxID=274613 RepID=UPI001F5FADE0|nr:uncharacterized protein LOC124795065 isoform X3 [Schistocerca piceifrons]
MSGSRGTATQRTVRAAGPSGRRCLSSAVPETCVKYTSGAPSAPTSSTCSATNARDSQISACTPPRSSAIRVSHSLAQKCYCTTGSVRLQTVKNSVEQCSGIHVLTAPDELLKTEKFSEAVSRLQHLRVLCLQERYVGTTCVLRPYVLRPLGDGCPRLVEIDFGRMSVGTDDLKYFLNAKNNTLKCLRIKWSVGGTRNGGLPQLKVLDLPHGYGVEDNTVIAISHGCPGLRQLSVTHATKLSPAAFSEIDCLEHLEILDVTGCSRLGGGLFPCLVGLPRLHTLRMGTMYFGTTYFTELQPGVSSILKLSGLRCLTFDYSDVTGVPFDKFPENLISLRELSVEGCQGDPRATDGLTEQMPNLVIRGTIHAELQPFYFEALEDVGPGEADEAVDDRSESDEDRDSDSSVGGSDSERG